MKALVLEVPALHAGYLGCYGNEWVETPALDLLAAEGVVFDQHCADCPDAQPRTAWTGRYCFPTPDENANLSSSDRTDCQSVLQTSALGTILAAHGIVCRRAPDWEQLGPCLKRLKSAEHWLLWMDGPSLHPPWQVPVEHLPRESDAEEETPWLDPPVGLLDDADEVAFVRLQNTYAAVVAWLDAQLGAVLEELDHRGLYDDVLLFVTAGRGLTLGEHGVLGDARPWLHEEVLHVPLLVRLPGAAEAGRRVTALTQPMDLLPTLLDAFGLPAPGDLHGRSLWPLLHGKADRVRAYACAGWRLGERVEWALRTPEWGFLLPMRLEVDDPPRGPQLYVKPDDRWEVNNVLQHHLEWGEHLGAVLRAFVTATQRSGPLSTPPLQDGAALE